MRYFRLLVLSNGVSAYGSYLNLVALNVFVYQVTGSPMAAGIFMAVRLLTSVGSGFVSGRLVSRFDRKWLMVGSDLVRAVMLLALLPLSDDNRLPLLFVLAFTTGACTTLHQVALRTSVPEIVGAELRVKANGLLVTGRSLAMIAGFASSGLVIAQFGYTTAFALNAVTFLVSAVILSSLPIRTRAAATEGDGASEDSGRASRWVSWVLLRAAPVMAAMLAIRGADALGSSSHNVALPIYSSELDPTHPATFISQFWATWAIGHIIALQLCSRYGKTGRTFGEKAFAAGSALMSVGFILVFVGLPTVPAVIAALIAGMADGFTEIAYVSKLQEAPDEQRGRLFGLAAAVENGGFGLGMLVSSALLEVYAPIVVVGLFHGLTFLLCIGFLVALVRRGRRPTGPPPEEGDTAGTPEPDVKTSHQGGGS